MYVFCPSSAGGPSSPDKPPEVAELEVDIADAKSVVRSVSGRSQPQQTSFSHAVTWRDTRADGSCCCVVCSVSIIQYLDAAHCIPRDEDELAHAYGLASSWDTRNGITLCKRCHRAFDAGLFYIHDNTVFVANGVLEDTEDPVAATFWQSRHQQQLVLPGPEREADWPTERTFSYSKEVFDVAQKKRHGEEPRIVVQTLSAHTIHSARLSSVNTKGANT